MNIKKILAAAAAAAVAAASTLSLGTGLNAYGSILQPLETIQANSSISGYTASMMNKVNLSEILDNMTYRYDIGGYVTDEEGNSTYEILHEAGEKIEFAEDAKYVWVGNEEFSIYDKEASIDLSSYVYYSSYSFEIIVGAAKQLSQTDTVYNVNVSFDLVEINLNPEFYILENDEEISIEADLYSDSTEGQWYYTNTSFEAYQDLRVRFKPTIDLEGKIVKVFYAGLGGKSAGTEYDNEDDGYYLLMFVPHKNYGDVPLHICIVDSEDENEVYSNEYMSLYLYRREISCSSSLYQKINSSDGYSYSYADYSRSQIQHTHTDSSVDLEYEFTLKKGLKLSDTYYLRSHPYLSGTNGNNVPAILKAVEGRYDTLDEAKDAEDIKNLFNWYYVDYDHFYELTFDKEYTFTIFLDPEDEKKVKPFLVNEDDEAFVVHLTVSAKEQSGTAAAPAVSNATQTDFSNDYFRLYGVSGEDNSYIRYFTVSSSMDTYFKTHYQTAFIYDEDGTVDMSKLILDVSSTEGANVYASLESSQPINFKEEPQDFSKESTIPYSVAAKGGQGYYPVTVKKNSTNGAELFVNGPEEREVYFDDVYQMYHDVLIANLGNEALTGLKVELLDAVNVRLDDYWRLDGEEDYSTLNAFTSAYTHDNLAKIRLRPLTDENGAVVSGEVSGTLRITADGQDAVTIKLKGHAGNPQIVSKSPLQDAVKYVPYSVLVAVDNIHSDWNTVSFELWSGSLPEGLSLNESTGEIYGVPKETGTFYVNIRANNSYSGFSSSSKSFTLTVNENTDENVYNASDENYGIKTPLGIKQGEYGFYLASANSDQKFASNGEFGDFIDFWLNGEKLVKGVDYDAESGSTVITIRSQTLMDKAEQGSTNTIAAEFRKDGDLENELKRTSQNFTFGYSGGSGSSGENTDTPSQTDPAQAAEPSETTAGETEFTPANADSSEDEVIKGAVVIAKGDVLPKDAVLNIKRDLSIPSEKGIAYDITFTLNGEEIQPKGSVLVKLPIPESLTGKTIYLYHIENEKYKPVEFEIKDNFICFAADHFSTYVISEKRLGEDGKEISDANGTDTEGNAGSNTGTGGNTGTDGNMNTGISISAVGMVISGAALAAVWLARKKNK